MGRKGALPEKAVPTTAAVAARKGMLPPLLAWIARHAAPPRIPFTLADQQAATVPGHDGIRFHADMAAAMIDAHRDRFLPRGTRSGGRPAWLVLSSGGAGGAFGAGVLTGWGERGDKPDFDLVTGVSAGALIAPFAFIGALADSRLAQLFSAASVAELNRSRSLLAGILGQSAIPAKPMRALIDAQIDADIMERIAMRHRAGARLLVVTTNLDAQRSVVWDLGAIAASQAPDRMRLFADVIEASASIPAILPPVRIGVTGNGKRFDELHADGGAIRQIYLVPDACLAQADLGGLRPDIHVIVNAELAPSFAVVPQQSIWIAERALASLEKSSALRSVAEVATLARHAGAGFRLAFIDRAIPVNRKLPFDPAFMQTAFELGRAKGRAGAWDLHPPVGTDLL